MTWQVALAVAVAGLAAPQGGGDAADVQTRVEIAGLFSTDASFAFCGHFAEGIRPSLEEDTRDLERTYPGLGTKTVEAMLGETLAVCRESIENRLGSAARQLRERTTAAQRAEFDAFAASEPGRHFLDAVKRSYLSLSSAALAGDSPELAKISELAEAPIKEYVDQIATEERTELKRLMTDEVVRVMAQVVLALKANRFLIPSVDFSAVDQARIAAAGRNVALEYVKSSQRK